MSIITRFPPEPNGYLHLGHLKAMMFDFSLHPNCQCILRLDDTNPETERKEYVESIIEDVKWLGYSPWKVTYTSDYFDQLYNYAIDLIKNNKAYVDFSSPDEVKAMRHEGIESIYRSYKPEWHLEQFEKMQKGEFSEDGAVLRLKIDMQNNNHTLRDPIAYRIKNSPHYRTGNKWKVYPSYDYSHGIVDALEEITYSYCTMEFYVRREQYFWPVLALGLKAAEVVEFGRLNMANNVLSKRKIIALVKDGLVDGFEDPRLLTIRGLRRRGFTPQILKNVIEHCSMERHDTNLEKSLVDYHLRENLNKLSERVFAVIDPIAVNIIDQTEIKHCKHSSGNGNSDHETQLSKNIYIEKSDFREVDEKSYYRLAPGKIVRLRYADFIEYVSHNNDEIIAKNVVPKNPKKIKGVIHWVSKEDSLPAKFELFDDLLIDGNYNKNSKIVKNGYIEKYIMTQQ